MGKVSQEDLDKVLGMFDALDEDGSGRLDADDILAAQRKKASAIESVAGGAAVAPTSATPPPEVPPTTATPPQKSPLDAVADGTAAMARGLGLNALAQPLLGSKK